MAWLLTAATAVVTVVLVVRHEQPPVAKPDDWLTFLQPTLFAALGATILTRGDGNRIGWLFLWVGSGLVLEPLAELRIAESPPDVADLLDVAAITAVNTSFFVFFIIPLALLAFLFPTGKPAGARWAWSVWAARAAIVALLVAKVFPIEIGPDSQGWLVSNPIGVHRFHLSENDGALGLVYGPLMIALVIAGPIAMIVRYRHADAVARSQMKWFAYAVGLWALVVLYRLLSDDRGDASGLVFSVATLLIPMSITLAILRYRLFDIDRIISRTVGYAIVIGILATGYVIGAVWLPTTIFGVESPVFVAGTTLGMAALFNPVRRHVLGLVDRRFFRSRYQAEQVIAGLAGKLGEETEIESLKRESLDVVARTMRPVSVGIWLKDAPPLREGIRGS